MLRRVLIANRGEIAVRIMRTCREMGIESVAIYSDADAEAMHVRMADYAVRVGPPPAPRSYLDVPAILEAARFTGADAVHPGYGFLAENAPFAEACREAGLTFVGPRPEVIARLGDKAEARKLARDAGVPVIPGTSGTIEIDRAQAAAREIGFPLLVKAAAGGGGRGIRAVDTPSDLAGAVEAAGREARAAFGDPALYLERRLVRPRHVEVQILGDDHGNLIHLYERECSLQRHRQKLLEEAPSPGVTTAVRAAMTDAALRLAAAAGYTNAGTVEFLLDGENFYFIEMNTRIQVEHPVTEMITGVDIVRQQLLAAAGERLELEQGGVEARGWALELRINAEDPDRGFFPSPGTITELEIPGGPGIRVDSALFRGATVPPFYDSLVSKLVAWHGSRSEVVQRACRAAAEYRIDGIKTTLPLLRRILEAPEFQRGAYHVEFLEGLLGAGAPMGRV